MLQEAIQDMLDEHPGRGGGKIVVNLAGGQFGDGLPLGELPPIFVVRGCDEPNLLLLSVLPHGEIPSGFAFSEPNFLHDKPSKRNQVNATGSPSRVAEEPSRYSGKGSISF